MHQKSPELNRLISTFHLLFLHFILSLSFFRLKSLLVPLVVTVSNAACYNVRQVVTFWEGEIVDAKNYTFFTGKWEAT